jgi:hypothetical protein
MASDPQHISRRSGVQFKRVGAPQPHEVANASARDAVKSMEAVHEESINVFQVRHSAAAISPQKHVPRKSHTHVPSRSGSVESQGATPHNFSRSRPFDFLSFRALPAT